MSEPIASGDVSSAAPQFGGRWLPEIFEAPLAALARGYDRVAGRRRFQKALKGELTAFAGRPTPLVEASRLGSELGGARLLLKREDRLESGSRHLNVALGHAVLAGALERPRLVTASATGAGAVAVATAAARHGLEATVYAGVRDVRLREHAFSRAETLGAAVVPIEADGAGVCEATQRAFFDWLQHPNEAHIALTAPVGPDPLPRIAVDFEAVTGLEVLAQMRRAGGRRVPDVVVAPLVGGGTVGLFAPFVADHRVRLICTGPSGLERVDDPSWLRPATLHGARTVRLRHEDAPLDYRPRRYPGLSGQLVEWLTSGRVEAVLVSDADAAEACQALAAKEGVLASVQSGEVLAQAAARAARLTPKDVVVASIVGRGGDDIGELAAALPDETAPPGPARDWPVDVDPGGSA